MNFKRHHDRDPVKKAGPSTEDRGGVLHRFRFFGRKKGREQPVVRADAPPVTSSARPSHHAPGVPSGDASINSSPRSDQLTNHEYSHSNQSLWDRAYEALGKESPDLVTKYQNLLAKEAQAMGMYASLTLCFLWILTSLQISRRIMDLPLKARPRVVCPTTPADGLIVPN